MPQNVVFIKEKIFTIYGYEKVLIMLDEIDFIIELISKLCIFFVKRHVNNGIVFPDKTYISDWNVA